MSFMSIAPTLKQGPMSTQGQPVLGLGGHVGYSECRRQKLTKNVGNSRRQWKALQEHLVSWQTF